MLGLQNSLEFRTPRLTALIATLPSSSRHLSHDYVTDRQMVNSARKTSWGMHCSGVQGNSNEVPPTDLGLGILSVVQDVV